MYRILVKRIHPSHLEALTTLERKNCLSFCIIHLMCLLVCLCAIVCLCVCVCMLWICECVHVCMRRLNVQTDKDDVILSKKKNISVGLLKKLARSSYFSSFLSLLFFFFSSWISTPAKPGYNYTCQWFTHFHLELYRPLFVINLLHSLFHIRISFFSLCFRTLIINCKVRLCKVNFLVVVMDYFKWKSNNGILKKILNVCVRCACASVCIFMCAWALIRVGVSVGESGA